MAWSAPLAGAWQDTTSHLRQGRGMQAMRKGGQRWLHIGFTSLPPAAAVLERFEVFGTLAAEGCVHPALRLGTSRLGVHQRPTLHDAAVGRLQPVRAIAPSGNGAIAAGSTWAQAIGVAVQVAGTRVIHWLPVSASFYRCSSLYRALSATRYVVPEGR